MFITYNMGNYEEDTIGNRLRYIDAMGSDSNIHLTLERYTDKFDPNTSIYGRKVDTQIKSIRKFIQDIEKEIRDTKKRIDYYVDAGKMGGQRETELRNVVQQYYKMKLDGIKTQSNLEREADKARKEDIKLFKDMNGNVPSDIVMNDRSSDRAFMTNILGGGVDEFFNSTTPPTNIPIQQYIPNVQPQPIQQNVVAESKQPINNQTILNEMRTTEVPVPDFNNVATQPSVQPTTQSTPQPEVPVNPNMQPAEPTFNPEATQVTAIIKNANGEDVPIYSDGPDDFIQGAKTYTNHKLAYENISLARDPNVQKFFKFNEKEGMGWLVYYDLEKKQEIKNKGSLRNIEQIFPFQVDKANNLVTTVLRETYPIIYTDETPNENVKSEYTRLRNIEESKKA